MKVKYCGPARDYSGYGEANRHDIAALVKAGVQITTQIPSYTLEISDYGPLGDIATKHENADIAYKIKIIHTTPNVYRSFMEPGKYHIGRAFWETDKVPLDFAENLQLMDEIWTGSRYNADAIKRAGVTKPITIIPEAIDPVLPANLTPYLTPEIPDNITFKFYSIFEWTERKNPLALLEAYWREFEGNPNVALVLKTYVDNFTPDRRQEIDNAIRMLKKQLALSHYAPIFLYRGLMDRYQVYRFHESFDCFVSAHRGEGWGVPQMEALLLGKPMISTNCGGIHEYLLDGIHAKLVPWAPVQVHQNSRNQQWYTSDQHWAQIDPQALRDSMRWVYDNQDAAKEMGTFGQRAVKELFSLETVGEIMRKRITEILNEPYEVHRAEQVVPSDGLRVGDIIEPEQLIEVPDPNGLSNKGSKFTIPPLVKKNRIKVDYYARPEPQKE